MSLSSPSPFGDVVEPSIEQDARGYLAAALVSIGANFGPYIKGAARIAISALGECDGLTRGDLVFRCVDEMDLDDDLAPKMALAALEQRSVIEFRGPRVYLNPAAAEAVTRELFR